MGAWMALCTKSVEQSTGAPSDSHTYSYELLGAGAADGGAGGSPLDPYSCPGAPTAEEGGGTGPNDAGASVGVGAGAGAGDGPPAYPGPP